MADNSRLKHLNVSLAVSSSASSVETEKFDQEYTEDFHSSLESSSEAISGKLSEISSNYSVNSDADVDDERLSKFIDDRLQALKQNSLRKIGRSQDALQRRESHEKLGSFWLKKLEFLQEKNTDNCSGNIKEKVNRDKLIINCNDKNTNTFNDFKPVTNVNEIGCFQSAYERLKFENLREKCRNLLRIEIHSLETCKECQDMQEKLRKEEFYASCVRKVKQNFVEEKLVEHLQSRSSALLIASIIEDGPKPTWSAYEIWDTLLSGNRGVSGDGRPQA